MSAELRVVLIIAVCVLFALTIITAAFAARLQRREAQVPLYLPVVCVASMILGLIVLNELNNFLALRGHSVPR